MIVNKRIKEVMKRYNLATWQTADAVGCSETTMFRKLRKELPAEEQSRIIELIEMNYGKKGNSTSNGK